MTLDATIVFAGHSGHVTACYLARAGLKVCDMIRFWTMSSSDCLDEHFEHPVIKAYPAVSASIGAAHGPMSPGSACVPLHHDLGDVDGNVGALGSCAGRDGSITLALAAAGGEIGAGRGAHSRVGRPRDLRGAGGRRGIARLPCDLQHGCQAQLPEARGRGRVAGQLPDTRAQLQDARIVGQALREDCARAPFEPGLDWMIDWDKGPFTGRRALAATKANGSSLWALVGLAVEGNIPVGGSPIYRDDQTKVDCVTAAAWSPAAKCNIASAQVRRPHDRKGELMVEVSALHALQYAKLMLHARVCPRPFFAPARRRGTPPGRF